MNIEVVIYVKLVVKFNTTFMSSFLCVRGTRLIRLPLKRSKVETMSHASPTEIFWPSDSFYISQLWETEIESQRQSVYTGESTILCPSLLMTSRYVQLFLSVYYATILFQDRWVLDCIMIISYLWCIKNICMKYRPRVLLYPWKGLCAST